MDPYAQLGFGLFGRRQIEGNRMSLGQQQQTPDVSSLIELAQNSEDEGHMNTEMDDVSVSCVTLTAHISFW